MTTLEEQFDLAARLVTKEFAGLLDKAGQPYVFHLFTVAYRCKSLFDKVVALLHDIVEDTDITVDGLLAMGFWPEIVVNVDAISRRDNETRDDYYTRCMRHESATRVKIEDLGHNGEVERFDNPTPKNHATCARYRETRAKFIRHANDMNWLN